MKHDYELRAGKVTAHMMALIHYLSVIKILTFKHITVSTGDIMKNKNKSKQYRPSKGYIIDTYTGSKELYVYFWNLTKRLKIKGSKLERKIIRQAYHHFLVHIYVGCRLKSIKTDEPKKPLTIPTYSLLIRSKFKGMIDVKLLKKKNIIRYTKYFHGSGGGRCREFRLHLKIYGEAIKIAKNHTITAWEGLTRTINRPRKVNLVTGRPIKKDIKSTTFLLSNNNKLYDIAPIVKESIASLLPCPFNPHAIIPYFKNVEMAHKREIKNINLVKKKLTKRYPSMGRKKIAKLDEYIEANKKLQKIRGLYLNIMLSMETIIAQNPQPLDLTINGQQLYEYRAAYRPQKSGRISEIHGGFQNITTPCKKLLLQNVPNIFNYDLKNSQAVILYIELKYCGIKCKWLRKYIKDKTRRKALADEVGITESCWKSCFYSIVMGSPAGGVSAVYDAIRKESNNTATTKRKLKKFKQVAKPIMLACKQWREHLFHSTDRRYKYRHNGYHWKNTCGMTFKEYITVYDSGKTLLTNKITGEIITKPSIISEVKRQLPAFYLQGKEAFYIHTLTLKCNEHSIPVYKNEHDGLITGKKIPKKLWQQVASEVDAKGISLEIKKICSPSKWETFETMYNSSSE